MDWILGLGGLSYCLLGVLSAVLLEPRMRRAAESRMQDPNMAHASVLWGVLICVALWPLALSAVGALKLWRK